MKKTTGKKIFKGIAIALGVIILLGLLFVLVLTITEYKPADEEKLEVKGQATQTLSKGDSLSIMTWNVGYGALGENADFFMDGGKSVSSSTKEEINGNLASISTEIANLNPDILFLQELDQSSTRSYYINEKDYFDSQLEEYTSSFATNYRTLWVPYPWPMIGKVDAGINTYSKYEVTDATRDSLFCPFTYPMRLCNLKRCIMISRIPVENSDKELVVINLHLEAYDSGEGKIKQTQMLKEIFESEMEKGNYVIAGGDFNQTFSGVDNSNFPLISEKMWTPGVIEEDQFDESLQFLMDEQVPSCRSLDQPYKGADEGNFQYYCIDGFIVTSNITVNSFGVEDFGFKNADHNPLLMNITLN